MNEIKIKRYQNRKLYDLSQSRYITLTDVAGLVKEGKTVSVSDSKSGQDLTKQTLIQCLVVSNAGLSVETVLGLIRQ